MSIKIQNGILDVTTSNGLSSASLVTRADGIQILVGNEYDEPVGFDLSSGGLDSIFPTVRMTLVDGGTINVRNLPEYADNAAALDGGLSQNDVYKTSSGELRIVYSPLL